MTDYPPGEWSEILVGHVWAAGANLGILSSASTKFENSAAVFHHLEDQLHQAWSGPLASQEGRTAEDARAAFQRGERQASEIAKKNETKQAACNSVYNVTSELRAELTTIAEEGNSKIQNIQDSEEPLLTKIGRITEVVADCQTRTNATAATCADNVFDAIQKILDKEAVAVSARQFAKDHGIDPARMFGSPSKDAVADQVRATLDRSSPIDGQTVNVTRPTVPNAPVAVDGQVVTRAPQTKGPVLAVQSDSGSHGVSASPGSAPPSLPGLTATPTAPAPPLSPATPPAMTPAQGPDGLQMGVPAPAPPVGTTETGATYIAAPAAPASPPSAAPVNPLGGIGHPAVVRHPATQPTPPPQAVTATAAATSARARLRWAAGDRPDGTTVLVTDPARARQVPVVEDLGWELCEATKRRDGLPRLAHTMAKAACRGTGVPDSEIALLREHLAAVSGRVLNSYPDGVDAAAVADWQLLAAIDALVASDKAGANYHFAWFQALSRVGAGGTAHGCR